MIRKIETVLSPTLAEAPESPTLAEAPESQTLVEASKSQTADAGGGAKSDDYLA
ncbi:MAG: hypothetical protein Ta2A_20790 [Treponemataceae bacterium]|nr:MAG: hypothetical protein Ta2A_20790 [Treponemataceae bacterium]